MRRVKKKMTKTHKRRTYSAGELNRLVDDFIHPLYKRSEWFRMADAVLHGLVEKNVEVTVKKFARYNVPDVVKKILEEI